MSVHAKPTFGAAVAAVLGIVAFAATLPFLPRDSWEGGIRLVSTIIVAGIPVGVVLGWRSAWRVGAWNPLKLIGWMAVSAVVLGDVEVCIVLAVAGSWSGQPEFVVVAPLLFPYGLLLGIFVLPLTLAAAVLWFATYAAVELLVGWAQRGPGVAGAS
jgi:hypothetical protein